MENAHFAVISDLHYFSEKLTDGKRAYELRSGSDQKCLLESRSIISAAFEKLKNDPEIDTVIIPGDLSDDGEICSHREICELLKELQKYKKVYVTTATHDFCCDGNARAYFGDREERCTDTADIPYLRSMYDIFGADEAVSKYEIFNGLCSYVVKLSDGVRLFALNDDQNGNGSSGFDSEHFDWILSEMKKAKEAGDRIVVMQHHVVLKHYTELLTKSGICCGDRERVAELFADNGAELLFVGHSHWQNITKYESKSGNILYQVNVASLSGYPSPIFKVHMENGRVKMFTEYLGDFTYNGEKRDINYLRKHSLGLIENVLEPAARGDKKEFSERVAALGVKSEMPGKLFPLIKAPLKVLYTANVGKFAKKVNLFTFGKGIDKFSVEKIKDKRALDIAYDIFLNLFDGGLSKYKKDSPEYRVVSDIASLPGKVLSRLPFIPDNIKEIAEEIHELVCMLADDDTDNNFCEFELREEK